MRIKENHKVREKSIKVNTENEKYCKLEELGSFFLFEYNEK